MGNLLINKVLYKGDKYFFESPKLSPGLSIVEGPNGSGKSTFMNFIYYGLSGRVEEFSSSNRETHSEIIHDTNNYVQLDISINEGAYQVKRFLNSNDITILTTEGEVLILPIHRTKNEKHIFSDWILEKLNISVVEVFQGVNSFRINFKDLFRLIYHNQELNPRKIFKPEDSDNIIADSEVVRKIIFELLIGKTFSDYYGTLAKYKEEERKRNLAKGLLDEYVSISKTLSQNKDDLNIVFLKSTKVEREEQLGKLYSYRESLKRERPKSTKGLNEINFLKAQIQEHEIALINAKRELNELVDELLKLERLHQNIILEVTQIKKIVHSHEKLNLFSADTCPYCLRDVDRKHGHCVCGKEIDENQYERFFYNSEEYLDILRSKQKSVETVEIAIKSCTDERERIQSDINKHNNANELSKDKIAKLVQVLDSNVDVSKLNEVDDQILKVKEELALIDQTIQVESKRAELTQKFQHASALVEELRNELKRLESQAVTDISDKVKEFNVTYNELMTTTLKNCRNAQIGLDDYMPIIDGGAYREASSSVATRLMYYLTLLRQSLLNSSVKFPRLLLIDTPETAGVDQDNLISSLTQIDKVTKDTKSKFQILLTTGIEKYPKEFQQNVVLSLSDDNRLLTSVKP